MAYDGLSLKTLRGMERRFAKKLKHKRAVMARHELGTAYHTRAKREVETYSARLQRVRRAIEGKCR